jgi:hypothetical protein
MVGGKRKAYIFIAQTGRYIRSVAQTNPDKASIYSAKHFREIM